MRRLLATVVLALVPALPAAAGPVDVVDLDADPGRHAGTEVTIRGEIVGDYGVRDDVVWVQVNDDPYVEDPLHETGEPRGVNVGIGVRIPRPLFDPSWGAPGTYLVRGPVVQVTGVFRYNDPATGGETFVDVSAVELIEGSRALDQDGGLLPLVLGGLAVVLGAGIFSAARWRWNRPPR